MNNSDPIAQHPLFQRLQSSPRQRAKVRDETITLAHGSGGKAMRDLIVDIFVSVFDNPILAPLADQAILDLASLSAQGDRLAFTTDSYVVDPLFFPGGDIGMLAVNGTVNDLAVSGAKPLYLSCSFIVEEGLPIDTLRRVVASMKIAADRAHVQIVTGDTKVVQRGAADRLFINTAGVGVIRSGINCAPDRIQVGDVAIVNGELGNHGAAISIARGEFALESEIVSDCQPLHDLVETILTVCPEVRAMRDLTRGGLATVLTEFAHSAQVGFQIEEPSLPINPAVRGLCEILGLDPLYLANEGKLIAIVPLKQPPQF
jgi:hydrogenase expression/formation protein HypE